MLSLALGHKQSFPGEMMHEEGHSRLWREPAPGNREGKPSIACRQCNVTRVKYSFAESRDKTEW